MADKEEKAVKNEGLNPEDHRDDNVPISAIDKGKDKMVAYGEEEEKEDADEEEPLLSRATRKFSGIKIGEARDNAMPPKAYKKQPEGVYRKEGPEGDNKKENSKGKGNQDKKSNSGKAKNVKVKKVYDLPGQKYDPPEERDPSRIFYETTHKQKPDSEMAKVWMMEQGLLPEDEAKVAFEKKKNKGSSPAKSPSAKKSPARSSVKRSLDSSTCSDSEKDNSAKNKEDKADSDSEEDDYDFTGRSKLVSKKKQKVSN